MANLFWTPFKKRTIDLIPTPFKSESEFEEFIYNSDDILQGVTIIKRQIRGGHKSGIPDMIGIDEDGNICIIEMKNVTVDEKIFSQILAYAIWAKSSPDSIKNLWYELEDKPDIQIDWESYEVRIMVIAPDINPNALNFVSSIQYKVDFIEVKRWLHKKDSFLLVNYLEQKEVKKATLTRGLEVYDKEFYDKHRNKKSVVDFLSFVKDVEALLKSKGIKLDKKFNKHYCGFMNGMNVIFSISWIGSKSFGFRVRMKESELKKIKISGIEMSYSRGLGTFKIMPGKTKATRFLPIIKKAMAIRTDQ